MLSTYKFGIIAEYIAIFILKIKLYKIIATRYRSFTGEIDIIAMKGNSIIFVEVKARKNFNPNYELISSKQIKRIKNTASLFLAQNQKFQDKEARFDAILILGKKLPQHLKNVW